MADSTVTALTAASALDGTELLYGVQGGADRKLTPAQVDTYASATTKTLTNKTIAGANNTLSVREADLATTDVTTGDASTSKHGLLKKLSNVATEYMNGQGAWTVPAGGGGITVADTQVLFADGANNPAGDAGLTYNKTTDALTVSGALFVRNGSYGGGNGAIVSASGTTIYFGASQFSSMDSSGNVLIEASPAGATFSGYIYPATYFRLGEIAAPSAPAANLANLWIEDDGAGKSRLMVRFASGAAQQIAIEP